MKDKDVTVYHISFEWDKAYQNMYGKSDFYFGSIAAIYEKFTPEEIGIQAQSLYN